MSLNKEEKHINNSTERENSQERGGKGRRELAPIERLLVGDSVVMNDQIVDVRLLIAEYFRTQDRTLLNPLLTPSFLQSNERTFDEVVGARSEEQNLKGSLTFLGQSVITLNMDYGVLPLLWLSNVDPETKQITPRWRMSFIDAQDEEIKGAEYLPNIRMLPFFERHFRLEKDPEDNIYFSMKSLEEYNQQQL